MYRPSITEAVSVHDHRISNDSRKKLVSMFKVVEVLCTRIQRHMPNWSKSLPMGDNLEASITEQCWITVPVWMIMKTQRPCHHNWINFLPNVEKTSTGRQVWQVINNQQATVFMVHTPRARRKCSTHDEAPVPWTWRSQSYSSMRQCLWTYPPFKPTLRPSTGLSHRSKGRHHSGTNLE